MTGERRGWFKVASHLGIPINELKERITFSEYVDWLTYLVQLDERDIKFEYYLAQIAAEVRRGQVKSPSKVKVKDFLVTFVSKPQADSQKSKSIWARHLKINLDKK